ncbi:non-ribosomal peptide synthetase [Stenotrophomonas sp. S48]|nr:non-ribosomal peptide synthetase [Stenotrophomonas sp. S48]
MRSDAPDDVHIGCAIANTRLLVLDRVGCRVPVGVVGELHIGGAGVSRGYLNRPDLTAERFVDDPSGHSGDRLYRTGDLVRWRPDGCLDYIGRMDQQVKVRGFRIELGEIEATLLAQAGVSEAVVSVHAAHDRDRKLIAHVTGHGLRAGQLKRALAEHLPEHMVPAVIDVLEQMPRLPNGKLDRNALPQPSDEGPTSAGPDNDSQSRLAALFSQVLGVSEVGVHDDFYARGGHSLLAIELLGLVNATFGTELVLRDMFQSRTVAELSVLIEQNRLVERLLVHVDEDDSTLETFEF